MAKTKTGFIYYNIDTDRYQDKRIKRLRKDLGCNGVAVYDYILCEIYRVKGCFIKWDEDTAYDVADYWGLKETQVNEIVNYCCSVGLFNKALLTNGGILSSSSIQSRYLEMSLAAKRKNVKVPEECEIIPEECAKVPEETPILPEEIPLSKVKKSKVEESKVLEANASAKTEVLPDEQKLLKSEYASVLKTRENIFQFLQKKPTFPDPFIDYWNLFAEKYGFAKVSRITDTRTRKIKTRLAKDDFDITRILFKAKDSEIITGGKWFSFDWIIENEGNYLKVLEGNYDNKETQTDNKQAPIDKWAELAQKQTK